MSSTVLLCDLSYKGRVNVALWKNSHELTRYRTFEANDVESFETAVLTFLDSYDSPFLSGAALAAPGWEHGGTQHMPNHGYSLERERLRKVFNVMRLNIVNPTVARALYVPHMKASEYEILCPGEPAPDFVKTIIGTGRGLGIATLLSDHSGGWTAFSGAGGHIDLTANGPTEQALLSLFRAKFGHVSRERAISLHGICTIWEGLCTLDGETVAPLTHDAIVDLAKTGNQRALKTVELCLGWLAEAASDIAIITGSRGGVYISGELLDLFAPLIDREVFRRRFCDKGRLTGYMEAIEVYFVRSDDCALKGLATLFQ